MMFARAGLFVELFLKDQQFRKGLASIRGNLGLVKSGAMAAGAAVIAAFGAGSIAAKGLFKLAADAETTATSFKVLIGEAKEADRVLGELKKFGAETPFEFPELATAGKKLLAFGVGTRDLLPTLKRLGDVSSGLEIPIGELAEIYGKARVQGRLFAEDINQLTGRGIPIIEQFAAQFQRTGESIEDAQKRVRGLVTEGKIGFPELEKAFIAMTSEGGKFNGMMAEQSKTLNGMTSTVTDNIKQAATAFGQLFGEGMNVKGLFQDLVKESENLSDSLNQNQQIIQNTGTMFGEIIRQNMVNAKGFSEWLSGQQIGDPNSTDAQFWRASVGDTPMRGSNDPWKWSRDLTQADTSEMSVEDRAKQMGVTPAQVRLSDRLAAQEEAESARQKKISDRRRSLMDSPTSDILSQISQQQSLSQVLSNTRKIKPAKDQDWQAVLANRTSPVKDPFAAFEKSQKEAAEEAKKERMETSKAMRENRMAQVRGFDVPDELGFEDDKRRYFEEALGAQRKPRAESTGAFFSASEALAGGQAIGSPQKQTAKGVDEIRKLMIAAQDRDKERLALEKKFFGDGTANL